MGTDVGCISVSGPHGSLCSKCQALADKEMSTRKQGTTRTCSECKRVFDMLDDVDVMEWYYGHDCESA